MDFLSFPCVFFSSASVLDMTDAELLALQGEEYYNDIITLTGPETPILGRLALKAL